MRNGSMCCGCINDCEWTCEKETDMTVHLAGGDLIIRWKDNDHVLMTGPAETICDGTFYL